MFREVTMSTLPADARDRYFDRLPAPLWAVDADDRTVDVNPAVVEALGYPVEELLGRSPAEFLTEESRATYRAQSILRRSGLSDTFTVTFRTRSGGERVFRVSGSPIYEGDRYVGKIAILRDVAVWNAIEGAVREANLELLADLRARAGVRDLSHDLRNPLQAILGFADLLLGGRPGPLTDEQRLQVGMIARSARDALDRLHALEAGPPGEEPPPLARQDGQDD
jgi:PAS domain S-box-containing protein